MPERRSPDVSRVPRWVCRWTVVGTGYTRLLRMQDCCTGRGDLLGEHGEARPLTVYLDVDGVVTTVGYQRQAGKDKLNPAQVAMVAALVQEFDAKVVVSSTWRIDDCRPILIEAGLPENCFHPDWRTAILPTSRDGVTGAMRPAERAGRGDEISDHLNRNHITHYLVLDDVAVGPAHAGRHVRPVAALGFSEMDGVLARSLLAGIEDVRLTEGQSDSSSIVG